MIEYNGEGTVRLDVGEVAYAHGVELDRDAYGVPLDYPEFLAMWLHQLFASLSVDQIYNAMAENTCSLDN